MRALVAVVSYRTCGCRSRSRDRLCDRQSNGVPLRRSRALHTWRSLIPYDRLSRAADDFADLLVQNSVERSGRKRAGQAALVVIEGDLTLPFLRRTTGPRTAGGELDDAEADGLRDCGRSGWEELSHALAGLILAADANGRATKFIEARKRCVVSHVADIPHCTLGIRSLADDATLSTITLPWKY